MKLKKLLFASLGMAVLFFTSCKTEDPITGITLSEATITLAVDDTVTLAANLLPAGSEATVTWTTSNSAIVTVDKGLLTAIAEGTADITASAGGFTAKCTVTVTPAAGDFSASLKGTEYYPFILDGTTSAALGTKIKADLRPDEATKFLYIWDNTLSAGTTTGPNFYGEVEGWTSLVVGSVGWSGGGFFCKDGALIDKLAPITANPTGYYLHIGIKSRSNQVFVFGMDGQSNTKFAVGATAFNDNGTMIQPLADFTRNGEWQEIEIPMSTLKTNGLLYSTGLVDKNLLWFLAGGTAGTQIDLDAVFIYKK